MEANGFTGKWYPIKGNPWVLTDLIQKFGVKGVQVEELLSIDEGIIENLRHVHGFIIKIKDLQHEELSSTLVADSDKFKSIYFAKEVIINAGATQAVINLLLNCSSSDVSVGLELAKLKQFSMCFDPQMRGLTLSNSEFIRMAHFFSSEVPFLEFDQETSEVEDKYIGYIPIQGRLYELDGLRDGPIDHGPIPASQHWVDVARPIIMNRVNAYIEREIDCKLMALISDRKMVYEREIDQLIDASEMEEHVVENTIRNLVMLIQYEEAKRFNYRQEKRLKKLNHKNFIMTLLQSLVENLQP